MSKRALARALVVLAVVAPNVPVHANDTGNSTGVPAGMPAGAPPSASVGAPLPAPAGAPLPAPPGPPLTAPAGAPLTAPAGTPSTAPIVVPAAAATESASADAGPGAMAWLAGCWQGSVNKRDFREAWQPLRGGMMVGVSQTVMENRTVDYEFLRLETRSDGVYYVVSPPGKAELAFKLTDNVTDKNGDRIFGFADPAREFPRRIVYHRGTEGWLYVEVEGKLNTEERKVIYPMRHIDCETGELILK